MSKPRRKIFEDRKFFLEARRTRSACRAQDPGPKPTEIHLEDNAIRFPIVAVGTNKSAFVAEIRLRHVHGYVSVDLRDGELCRRFDDNCIFGDGCLDADGETAPPKFDQCKW